MASYHVLTGTPDGNAFRVVFHVPIAAANNRAGLSYRTALVNSGIGGKSELVAGDGTIGTISAAELASIQAGSVFEYAEDFATNPAESAAALKARIDARYTTLAASVPAALANRLSYFGFLGA